MKKTFSLILCVLIIFNMGFISTVDANTVINIPDKNFKAVLTQHLGLSTNDIITIKHMESITYFVIYYNFANPNPIYSLEGIQYATNMYFLQINNHPISDISPLNSMPNLKNLYLENTRLRDVNVVATLTNLESFSATNNYISDILPLTTLERLKYCALFGNLVDLSCEKTREALSNMNTGVNYSMQRQAVEISMGIASLPDTAKTTPAFKGLLNHIKKQYNDLPTDEKEHVKHLDKLENLINQVANVSNPPSNISFKDTVLRRAIAEQLGKSTSSTISPADMLSIKDFTYYLGGVTSLEGLEYAYNLEVININESDIKSIEPLRYLYQLKYVMLADNEITDSSPLTGKYQLQGIYLSANKITSIDFIKTSYTAYEVYLNDNAISDISPMKDYLGPNVNMQGNNISDISPLASAKNIRELNLAYNQIADITGLEKLNKIKKLNLSYNKLSDIGPLQGLTSIMVLDLGHNQITDISPLHRTSYPSYSYSDRSVYILSNNNIADFSPLSNINGLFGLDLSFNNISCILPLSTMSYIHTINLSNNKIFDLSPLELYKFNQIALDISNNNIETIQKMGENITFRFLDITGNYLDVSQKSQELIFLKNRMFQGYNVEQHVKHLPQKALGMSKTFNTDLPEPGAVSYKHDAQIIQARQLYDEIDEEDRKRVVNYNRLVEAEDAYSKLKDPAEIYPAINSGLKEYILSELDKPSNHIISVKDMQSLTELYLDSTGINNLEGLSYATRLEVFSAFENNLRDLSELGSLRLLEYVDISGNKVDDISALQYLTRLELLDASMNKIRNTKALNLQFNLQYLDLSDNFGLSINPTGFTELEFLNLSNCGLYIYNFAQYAKLRGLQYLDLSGSYIITYNEKELDALKVLDDLVVFLASGCNLRNNINWLPPNLEVLDLSSNNIETYSMALPKNLTFLSLADNSFQRFPDLSYLTELTFLDISDNRARNFSGLKRLTSLEYLGLSNVGFNDFSHIKELNKLTMLDVSSNYMYNISGIVNLPNLQMLDLSENNIQNISSLSSLNKLEAVDISINNITDISPLFGLTELTLLGIADNKLSDFNQIKGLPNSLVLIDMSYNYFHVYDSNIKGAIQSMINKGKIVYYEPQKDPILVAAMINEMSMNDPHLDKTVSMLRALYNSLSSEDKAHVINYSKLVDAEAYLASKRVITILSKSGYSFVNRNGVKYIRGITASTTVSKLLSGLSVDGGKLGVTSKGKAVSSSTNLATGMAVELTLNSKVIDQAVVIVSGDVSGDGAVNVTDILQTRAHILGKSKLTGPALLAADMDNNGSVNVTDILKIRAAILGK